MCVKKNRYRDLFIDIYWERRKCSLLNKVVCVFVWVHGCTIAPWQVTTGTASSRAIKAQGTLRQWKDKQHSHPGMLCGQLRKNKSLYAHGRIIITRQWCVAIIMLRGLQTSYQHYTPEDSDFHMHKFAHPLVSVYPIDFTQLHTRHGWRSGTGLDQMR